jgi:hypothetical protein
MNREDGRLPEGLKVMDGHAAGLSSDSLDDPQQFLPELHRLPRTRFKPDEKVNGQEAPPGRPVWQRVHEIEIPKSVIECSVQF